MSINTVTVQFAEILQLIGLEKFEEAAVRCQTALNEAMAQEEEYETYWEQRAVHAAAAGSSNREECPF